MNTLIVFFLAIASIQGSTAKHNCPSGYELNEQLEACYFVDRDQKSTFDGAREQCQNGHGDLTVIGSHTENLFLLYLMHSSGVEEAAFFGYKDGSFVNVEDPNGSTDFSLWEKGGMGKDTCAALTPNYAWAEADCSSTRPYICEIGVEKCPSCPCRTDAEDTWVVKRNPCLEICKKHSYLDLDACLSCCSCCESSDNTCLGFTMSNELGCLQYASPQQRVGEVLGFSAVCEPSDVSCPSCDCESPEVLLIAGGWAGQAAEVMSLADEPITCDQVPDLPVETPEWGAFFKHNEDPVFCEGLYGSPCFRYSPFTKTWESFGQLTMERYGAAKMEFEGHLYFTGGHTESADSSDYWNAAQEQFEPGPKMPVAAQFHCIVTLNETHALMTGGYDSVGNRRLNEAYVFNRETEKWTQVPSMQESRYGHMCGLLGDSKVLVAGGWNDDLLATVEIFDLDRQTWSYGEPLPYEIVDGTAVQNDGNILIVGGFSKESGIMDTIHEFDVESNAWLLWEQRMVTERDWKPAVYKLSADYLNCA